MGSILGKAQADRERNRDCFARVSSKRPETRSLVRSETRDTRRIRNRYRDQTGRPRALRFCHVDPGTLFKLGLRSAAEMQHEQSSSNPDESVAETWGPRNNTSGGDGLPMPRLRVTA